MNNLKPTLLLEPLKLITLCLILIIAPVKAEDNSPSSSVIKDLQIGLGVETSYFSLEKQDIYSGGARIKLGYVFLPKWRAELGLSQTAAAFDGEFDLFYTSISLGINYSLTGQMQYEVSQFQPKGKAILTEVYDPKDHFQIYIAANVEQYTVSGSESSIPLTGLLVGGGVETKLRDFHVYGEAKTGRVSSSADSGSPIILGIGIFKFFN